MDHMDRVKKMISMIQICFVCTSVSMWTYEHTWACSCVCVCPTVCLQCKWSKGGLSGFITCSASMWVFFFFPPVARRTKIAELMTMSDCDAGISLLTSSIPHLHFISGHATSPHVKGQAGLRYHCDFMLPYGQAGRQAGTRPKSLSGAEQVSSCR